jgi:hypothetical protein
MDEIGDSQDLLKMKPVHLPEEHNQSLRHKQQNSKKDGLYFHCLEFRKHVT